MSNYNYDKYAVPNKWIEESFEKLADLCELCKKEEQKVIVIDTCPQFEPKKGN